MDSDILDLSHLPVGNSGIIVEVHAAGLEKDRFTDLGFVPSMEVKSLFKSPMQNPTAYQVMGAVLALRTEDAAKIIVRKGSPAL